MGYYINPLDGTDKEEWLELWCKLEMDMAHATGMEFHTAPKDHLIVCLVDNGPFTAAAVAYSEQEYHAFLDPNDRRRKRFFLVSLKKVLLNSDLTEDKIQR